MGIIQKLKQLFRFKSEIQSLQSFQSPIQSLESRFESPKADLNHDLNQSIRSVTPDFTGMQTLKEVSRPSQAIEIEKDSLQLGVAAGYAGRALKEIESSLNRIESNVITKDWFTLQFKDRTPELIELIRNHDENTSKKFESIAVLLESLKKTVEKAPEPIRTEILAQVKTMEAQLPATKKMQKLISIVQEKGEINYTDLAFGLDISESALRGLLSNTMKRTDKIERFTKAGKGWVRFIGTSDGSLTDSADSNDLNQTSSALNSP